MSYSQNYTLLAEYLFKEASSGQSPTTVNDSSGAGNNLTITLSTGTNPVWTSLATGRGLYLDEYNNSGVLPRASAASATNTSVRTALNGSKTATLIIVFDNSVDFNDAYFSLNLPNGADDGIGCYINGGSFTFMVQHTSGDATWGLNYNRATMPSGRVILHLVFDSANATATRRERLYINGVFTTPGFQDTVTLNGTAYISSGSVMRIAGAVSSGALGVNYTTIYYAAFVQQAMTDADVLLSYNSLVVNDDISPFATTTGLIPPQQNNYVFYSMM